MPAAIKVAREFSSVVTGRIRRQAFARECPCGTSWHNRNFKVSLVLKSEENSAPFPTSTLYLRPVRSTSLCLSLSLFLSLSLSRTIVSLPSSFPNCPRTSSLGAEPRCERQRKKTPASFIGDLTTELTAGWRGEKLDLFPRLCDFSPPCSKTAPFSRASRRFTREKLAETGSRETFRLLQQFHLLSSCTMNKIFIAKCSVWRTR